MFRSMAIDLEAKHVVLELAMASITAGLHYLQLIRLKEALGHTVTWADVDAAIERNNTIWAQLEVARKTKN